MRTGTVYGLVVLATAFWGANFVLAGPVMNDLHPLWAAALRFMLGAGAMFLLARWRGERLAELGRRYAGVYALLGVVGIGAFNLLFFYALKSTSPANAALIMATNPLVTTLIAAVVLRERPNRRQLSALPITLIGVMVVISGGSLTRLEALNVARGDLLMLGANIAWALYNVLSKRYMPRVGSAVANTTLVMCAGAALLLTAAITEGGSVPAMPGTAALTALVVMALAGTVLAYLFWNTGIARLGAGRTALFLNLVPVFAMLAGSLGGALPTCSIGWRCNRDCWSYPGDDACQAFAAGHTLINTPAWSPRRRVVANAAPPDFVSRLTPAATAAGCSTPCA